MAPLDFENSGQDELRFLERAEKHQLISIPTANIWGSRDAVHTHTAPKLAAFCSEQRNINLVHAARTPIPGAADEKDLVSAAHAIRHTIGVAIGVN